MLKEPCWITTAPAAIFLRNKLKDWPTAGGTKNRELLLKGREDYPELSDEKLPEMEKLSKHGQP